MFVEEKSKGEVTELDAVSKLLLKAAALIEDYGHCKHVPRDSQGRFCIYGALGYSHLGHLEYGPMNAPEVYKAAERISQAVGMGTVDWNNAKERTADEVISALRAVAFSS